jgi:hypothetical protein
MRAIAILWVFAVALLVSVEACNDQPVPVDPVVVELPDTAAIRAAAEAQADAIIAEAQETLDRARAVFDSLSNSGKTEADALYCVTFTLPIETWCTFAVDS